MTGGITVDETHDETTRRTLRLPPWARPRRPAPATREAQAQGLDAGAGLLGLVTDAGGAESLEQRGRRQVRDGPDRDRLLPSAEKHARELHK